VVAVRCTSPRKNPWRGATTLPFVPTARRTVAPTDTVSAFVQVRQGTTRMDALQGVTLRVDEARGQRA
jgi:hypothetical protein